MAIGNLYSIGASESADSSGYGHERQLEIACDLDELRLEQIERVRDGGPATTWLALWPTLSDRSGFLSVQCSTIRVEVPRDTWVRLLGQLCRREIALLEIPFTPDERQRFKAAIGHVGRATGQVRVGEYDDALGSCRRALEALAADLGVKPAAEAIGGLLARSVDQRQAGNYAKIFSVLKDLANATVHRSEPNGLYSRAEARFVVAATTQLIVLLAALADSAEDPAA